MDIRNGKLLRERARQRLDYAAYDPKKLALLHGGVMVGASLLISLISLLISYSIRSTGGLGGIGTRNILETVEALVDLAYSVAMPFWQVGILFSFMCIARKQYADKGSLLRGFSRLGPVFFMLLLEVGLYFLLAMASAYISSFLSMGFSGKMITVLEPVVEALQTDPNADMMALVAQIPTRELLGAMAPMLCIFLALFLTGAIFFGYRLRFARYLILEEQRVGAYMAMRMSFRMTKGYCVSLFKLDLGFWKYYLLQALAVVISFGDLILEVMGVSLPISGQWVTLICYCVYGAVVLALDYWMRPTVEATYALAYETVKNPPLAVVNENM